MKFFRKREPTKKNTGGSAIKMITMCEDGFYAWDGKLYKSDVVRSCIRPKTQAIGKLVGKHIRDDPKKGIEVNPNANIRFILSEPNPYMTASQMQEKVANQLALNHNAFILIVRDENGKPMQLYPVPCVFAETKYNESGKLFLKFQYLNGKSGIFPYDDIIHIKRDFYEDDIFGDPPAPALSQMMEVVGNIDNSIIKAIKNSSVVRWLLTYNASMRPEDIKKNVEQFVQNYLSIETTTFGAAGTDAKAKVERIEPKDYVPNAALNDRSMDRIYSFFNTNKKIVQSDYSEDEWTAYYEAEIEPVVNQMQQAYSAKLFSRTERAYSNVIVFEADNLQCASLTTKLQFVSMVDRGAMTPNEWRKIINLAPIEGGDNPIRRLDTQVVNMVESCLEKMDSKNYPEISALIKELLKGTEKDEKTD